MKAPEGYYELPFVVLFFRLETTLRTFSCLTTGDNIMVAYNNKKYYIDIVETRPSDAISIIETDCEVDFAPPLDYVEPERPAPMKVPPQISGNPPQTKGISKLFEFSYLFLSSFGLF